MALLKATCLLCVIFVFPYWKIPVQKDILCNFFSHFMVFFFFLSLFTVKVSYCIFKAFSGLLLWRFLLLLLMLYIRSITSLGAVVDLVRLAWGTCLSHQFIQSRVPDQDTTLVSIPILQKCSLNFFPILQRLCYKAILSGKTLKIPILVL